MQGDDDRERHAHSWGEDDERGDYGRHQARDRRSGGAHGREERGRFGGEQVRRDDERRWAAGPERGRQGYPGDEDDRFGSSDYAPARFERGGYERGRYGQPGYPPQDYGRRDYSMTEPHRRDAGPPGYDRRAQDDHDVPRGLGSDEERGERHRQDRGRQYADRDVDRGGYAFQGPEQRPYDQGRSRGRGHDEGRYGPTSERERGGGYRGERPNAYGQEWYGGSGSGGGRPDERDRGAPYDDDRGYRRRYEDRDDDARDAGPRYDPRRFEADRAASQEYARQWGRRPSWGDRGWRDAWQMDGGAGRGYGDAAGRGDAYGGRGDAYGGRGDAYGGRDAAYGDRDAAYGDRSGSFAGRGPRSFRRSDERIREDVCEMLTRHPDIDASDVDVEVRDGEVTLRGTVETRRARRMAEDAIEDLPGVRDVHNELRAADRERTGSWGPNQLGSRQLDGGRADGGTDPAQMTGARLDTGSARVTGDASGAISGADDQPDGRSGPTTTDPDPGSIGQVGQSGAGGVDTGRAGRREGDG